MREELVSFFRQLSKEFRSGDPLLVGKSLTKYFGILVLILALFPQYTADDGWQFRIVAIFLAPANEIGDTLAGIAGVLAFLWIIVTVWLQSQELSEQREELKQTREEVRLSREAQEKQVLALEAHAKFFEDEKQMRDETRAERILDQLFFGIAETATSERSWGSTWVLPGIPGEHGKHSASMFYDPPAFQGNYTSDELVRLSSESIYNFLGNIQDWLSEGLNFSKGRNKLPYKRLLRQIEKARSLRDRLSEDQNERLENAKVDSLHASLSLCLAYDIWEVASESEPL